MTTISWGSVSWKWREQSSMWFIRSIEYRPTRQPLWSASSPGKQRKERSLFSFLFPLRVHLKSTGRNCWEGVSLLTRDAEQSLKEEGVGTWPSEPNPKESAKEEDLEDPGGERRQRPFFCLSQFHTSVPYWNIPCVFRVYIHSVYVSSENHRWFWQERGGQRMSPQRRQ